MGSRISSKAKDNDHGSNKRLLSVSNVINDINNSDPVLPKEEANDKTKEDEVKILVEEQQETDQVKKQEEENDEDAEDEVKIEVEKKQEEGNQEGSSKETEASRDSHRARLFANAAKCGLKLRSDVQGDGNCYFRALADQLARIGLLECVNTTSHEVLRAEICDYMQHNPIPEMEHYVSSEYISNMRQNHQWAGEPEIVATKKKYGVNMKVVTSAACSTANEFYKHDFQEENATETLYLGHIHEKHYVSLEPDDDQDLTKDRGAPSPAMSSAGKLKGLCEGTDATTDGKPTKSYFCRVSSGVVALIFIVFGCAPIVYYIICYFGHEEYYLRFFGHMSYRPSLVLAPLIIFVAAFKAPEDPYTSWDNVFLFSKSSWKNKWKAIKYNKSGSIFSTVVIYISVPGSVLTFKSIFYVTTLKQSHLFFLTLWFVTEFIGVIIFLLFCLFLYLQRLVVQEASKEASRLLCHNVSQFRHCITPITTFFKEYYPLRSLMLPLVYIFLFESSFGIGSYLTWHYQHGNPSNGTSYPTIQPNWADNHYWCPNNCPALDFNHLKSSVLYNLWIVSRHIMTILLPYWSASGMDMKYIWDDFRTKCTYKYSEEHESCWRTIIAYMKELHPKTSTYTVLNIIVPLLALVAGVFTGNQF
ncbi:uncharacterized protein [Apostichopus japonicus]|uniref:uncharacterized protein n=1 Tax=Stichopus japonicus TaxID=307972 RepID=UPI003AB55459